MILDSSAVIACLLREPGHERLVAAIQAAPQVAVGAPTVIEIGLVLVSPLGVVGKTLLARFLEEAQAEVLPLAVEHWAIAVDAFLRYGKGRHPAALNFGDCQVYAVARVAGLPLLCTGDDFGRTDLPLVAVPHGPTTP